MERYEKLPVKIRRCVDNNFQVIKEYPKHPLLRLVTNGNLHSMRIDARFRAIGIQDQDDIVWFWVGTYKKFKEELIDSVH